MSVKRKIIQVALATEMEGGEAGTIVVALCNDGTVWVNWHATTWQQYPAIPQPRGGATA